MNVPGLKGMEIWKNGIIVEDSYRAIYILQVIRKTFLLIVMYRVGRIRMSEDEDNVNGALGLL